MIEFLAGLGAITIVCIVAVVIVIVIECIKGITRKLKLKYKRKHRFDKLPIAKCYCIDCTRHDNETGTCYKFDGWRTADNWFCWDAEPHNVVVNNATN